MQNAFSKTSFYWSSLFLILCCLHNAHSQTTSQNVSLGKLSFKMPQLPEGGGQAGLVRAIQQRVVYPRAAIRNGTQGQCEVIFTVALDGQVRRVKITHSIQADMDTAVVEAVRQLPRLEPATQFGKPVACLMTAPITFMLTPIVISKKPMPAADSTNLYTAVSQIPIYKGKPGFHELAADLVAEYKLLQLNTGCFVPHNNLGVWMTIGTSGGLYDLQLTKTDELEKAALSAEYGDAVPQQEEQELPATCVAVLEQAAKKIPHLTPAYADGKRVAMRLRITLLY